MLKRLALALLCALAAVPGAPSIASAAGCQFVLGFATMAAAVPQVGQCQEDQHYASNGDAQQHTTGGLLVWRKADNVTVFTDGYHSWVNGPRGLQQRLNSDRFDWECTISDCVTHPVLKDPSTPPVPLAFTDPDGQLAARGCWDASGGVQLDDAIFPGPLYMCIYGYQGVGRFLVKWFLDKQGLLLIEDTELGWHLTEAGYQRWPQFGPSPAQQQRACELSGGHWDIVGSAHCSHLPPMRYQLVADDTESIQSVNGDGAVIELGNGSVWLVDPIDRIDTALWLPADDVMLVDTTKCGDTTMINTDEQGETACVRQLN